MSTKPNQALIYRKVPTFMKKLREDAKLTQRDLAARTGKTQWWVTRIETGSRRIDVAEFIEWCRGCDMNATAMLSKLAGVESPSHQRRRRA
jgi:transcriptional regulator with XRE-family HTH domain